MATKTIRLTHSSGHPDGFGEPGAVITCDAALANRFIAGGGAVELVAEAEAEPVPVVEAVKAKVKRVKKTTPRKPK